MDTTLTTSSADAATRRVSIPIVIALAWSAVTAALALGWVTGLTDLPFDTAEPGPFSAFVELMPPALGAALIGVFGVAGLLVAGWALGPRSRPGRGAVLIAYAAALALFATLVVADARLMAVVGYTLSLHLVPVEGPVLLQIHMVGGAALWIAAAWRSSGPFARMEGRPVSRLARVAVGVAVAVPLVYAAVRFSWAVGIPFGISEQMLREGQQTGLWWVGLGLAAVATGAAILTMGLVRPWGERFPRWMPGLAGRRVPVLLAAIPGAIATLVILAAATAFVRVPFSGILPMPENLTTVGPELLWPLWALGLGIATTSYVSRRLRPLGERA